MSAWWSPMTSTRIQGTCTLMEHCQYDAWGNVPRSSLRWFKPNSDNSKVNKTWKKTNILQAYHYKVHFPTRAKVTYTHSRWQEYFLLVLLRQYFENLKAFQRVSYRCEETPSGGEGGIHFLENGDRSPQALPTALQKFDLPVSVSHTTHTKRRPGVVFDSLLNCHPCTGEVEFNTCPQSLPGQNNTV